MKTPPFVTPFALVSLVLALGATNVVVNKTTNTSEGAKIVSTSSTSQSTSQKDDQDSSHSSDRKKPSSESDPDVQSSHQTSSVCLLYTSPSPRD